MKMWHLIILLIFTSYIWYKAGWRDAVRFYGIKDYK